ncbi:zinc finger protein 236-like [Scleropages formosus]|uniref:Zinc finger protein 236-like n=1 Tax=Scleropages formosus TaxID=113540 RepID=A0A0P7VFK1_SCLFO|nr:zinc finger protein 236-like [Scleropages formosus]
MTPRYTPFVRSTLARQPCIRAFATLPRTRQLSAFLKHDEKPGGAQNLAELQLHGLRGAPHNDMPLRRHTRSDSHRWNILLSTAARFPGDAVTEMEERGADGKVGMQQLFTLLRRLCDYPAPLKGATSRGTAPPLPAPLLPLLRRQQSPPSEHMTNICPPFVSHPLIQNFIKTLFCPAFYAVMEILGIVPRCRVDCEHDTLNVVSNVNISKENREKNRKQKKARRLQHSWPSRGRHFEIQIVHSTPALNPETMPRGRPRKLRDKTNDETGDLQESGAENSGYGAAEARHFKCTVCSQVFTKESHLQRHLRDHEANDKVCGTRGTSVPLVTSAQRARADEPHRCDQCPMSFNVEFNLTLHKSTHNLEDLTCPECCKKFSRVASLKSHIMLHEKEENLICSECGDEFILQSQLSLHLEDHRKEFNGSKVYTCNICSKEFKMSSQLKEHKKTHIRKRPIIGNLRNYKKNIDRSGFTNSCQHCGKTFKKPSQLVRHIRIHTGERPYKCTHCGKAFNQKVVLQTHMVRHTGERPHLCSLCPASFSQKGNLHSHIQRVHSEVGAAFLSFSDSVALSPLCPVCRNLLVLLWGTSKGIPVYPCLDCSCVFKRLGSLHAHTSSIREENGVRWHVCPYCPKEFKKPSDLVRHIRIHTHEKPFKCKQCFRAFAVKSTLTAHMKTHTGIKAFECQSCMKCFSTSGSMKVHMRLHTGLIQNQNPRNSLSMQQFLDVMVSDRPYKCPFCNRAYKKSSHLKQHVRSHTGERPYKCSQCSKGFASSGVLKSHIRTHSGLKAYKCLMCDSTFTTSGSLRRHMTTHSDIRPYMCPYCQKTFKSSSNCRKHMKTHRCSYCSKGFKKSSHLKQHVRSHTGEKPYRCNMCGRNFVSAGVLKSHLNTHTGVKAFRCSVCDASFTTNGSLNRHMAMHTDTKSFKCPMCSETFRTNQHCKKHIKKDHEMAAREPKFANRCNYCPKSFKKPSDLDSVTFTSLSTGHNYGHFSFMVLMLLVGLCRSKAVQLPHVQHVLLDQGQPEGAHAPAHGLQALQVPLLRATLSHLRPPQDTYPEPLQAHGKERCHVCRVCSKAFKRATHLKEHEQVHQQGPSPSSQRPRTFRCSTCDKAFAKPSQLERHNRTHTGERPFKCPQCDKAFNQKSALQVHTVKHTGEKPYKCEVCCISFTQKSNMKLHMKRSHSYGEPRQSDLLRVGGWGVRVGFAL